MCNSRENFENPWGDRRQEIVFIGNDMKHDVVQQIWMTVS